MAATRSRNHPYVFQTAETLEATLYIYCVNADKQIRGIVCPFQFHFFTVILAYLSIIVYLFQGHWWKVMLVVFTH